MNIGSLVGTLGLCVVAYLIFAASRGNARESAGMRRRMILGSLLGVVLGVVFVFVLPRFVPETPGSPGTLAVVALLWVIGFCLVFAGLGALLGAIVARPQRETVD
jgi:hypothetical protein